MNLSGVNVGQTVSAQGKNTMTMQEGQVLHGTIKKLYPEQKAEIQIGGQKLIAKLETPMQAGNSHYFQVTGTEPDLKLKLVSGPIDSKMPVNEQIKQVMEAMKLPQTKDMQQIVTQFIKNDTPISKEQIIQAEQLLKSIGSTVNKADALVALQKIVELKLPMNEGSLNAIIQGGAKTGFVDELSKFEVLIKNDLQLTPSIKEAVLQQLTNLKMPLSEQLGSLLVGKMLSSVLENTASSVSTATFMTSLKEVLNLPAETNRFNLTQILFNKLPNATNNEMQQIAKESLTNTNALTTLNKLAVEHTSMTQQQLKSIQQSIVKMQLSPTSEHHEQLKFEVAKQLEATKPSISQLLAQLKIAGEEDKVTVVQQLAKTVAENSNLNLTQKQKIIHELSQLSAKGDTNAFKAILSAFSEQVGQLASSGATKQLESLLMLSKHTGVSVFENITQKLSHNSSPVIQQLIQTSEAQLQENLTSKNFLHVIKQTLQDLGLSLEAKLLDKGQDMSQLKETLKVHLQNVLTDQPQLSTRQGAEQIIARLNGQQLLSSENGPQQQIIMQIPLQMFGKRTDATLQWSGSKTKDGKIDSNFARIMFYLQLDSLEETVIDMQVQSRVVSLNVYSEKTDVKELIEPLKNKLKTGLENHDYHLSGVFIKNFSTPVKAVKQQRHSAEQLNEKGVDFRV